jgi:hypothetical protein
MNVRSPTLVTVVSPPRNGVWNAPGAFGAHACATLSFQNGSLVCVTIAMALVLPVMMNVSGRPFVTVAVMGMIKDFPAGTDTLPIGAMTGAADNHPVMDKKKQSTRHVAEILLCDLLFMSWMTTRSSSSCKALISEQTKDASPVHSVIILPLYPIGCKEVMDWRKGFCLRKELTCPSTLVISQRYAISSRLLRQAS